MNFDHWRPLVETAEPFALGLAAVAVASQVVQLAATVHARAGGATRAEARVRGRDAGMVTILVSVVVFAGAAALGWW